MRPRVRHPCLEQDRGGHFVDRALIHASGIHASVRSCVLTIRFYVMMRLDRRVGLVYCMRRFFEARFERAPEATDSGLQFTRRIRRATRQSDHEGVGIPGIYEHLYTVPVNSTGVLLQGRERRGGAGDHLPDRDTDATLTVIKTQNHERARNGLEQAHVL